MYTHPTDPASEWYSLKVLDELHKLYRSDLWMSDKIWSNL